MGSIPTGRAIKLGEKMIDTKEKFLQVFDHMKSNCRELFEKDGKHHHMVFLILKDKSEMPVILYDQIAHQIAQETPKGENLAYNDRRLTFMAIGSMAYEFKAIGYFEIGEGWALGYSGENKTSEEALSRYRKTLEEYKFIQNVPTRMEILFIKCRFREFGGMITWKIVRRGNEAVWLEPFAPNEEEISEYKKADEHTHSNSSFLDMAVDRVIEEETS